MSGGPRRASHREEEHTGELQIRVEAPTLVGLFIEAGRALMEQMGGGTPAAATGEPETITLHARDREALLVDWLNELIFRVETGRRLYGDLRVDLLTDEELVATVRGAPANLARTLVKAASFHGLSIESDARGHTATVVLDI